MQQIISFPILDNLGLATILQFLALLCVFIILISSIRLQNELPGKSPSMVPRFLTTVSIIQTILAIILLSISKSTNLGKFMELIPFLVFLSWFILAWIWGSSYPGSKLEIFLFIYLFFSFVLFSLEIIFSFVLQIQNLNIALFILRFFAFLSIISMSVCFLILLVKRPQNWFAGILLVLAGMTGIGLFLSQFETIQPPDINILLFIEIGSFLVLPLLPLTSHRTKSNKKMEAWDEIPGIVKSWSVIANLDGEEQIPDRLITALGKSFLAGLALLVKYPKSEKNQTSVFAENNGWKIRPNDKNKINPLIAFWKEGKKPLIVNKDEFSENQLSMLNKFGIIQPVNLLYYPLQQGKQNHEGLSIFLFSKDKAWNQKHLDLLEEIKNDLISILERPYNAPDEKSHAEKKLVLENNSAIKDEFTSLSNETGAEKIRRLEAELKLALEEYDRVHKLLEANIQRTAADKK